MNEIYEALKGFTDVPIALLAAVFGMALCGKGKSGWQRFFFLLSVTAFIGAAVHIFAMPHLIKSIVWVILYALLFECVRRATDLLCGCIAGDKVPVFHAVFIAEAMLYIGAVCFMIFVGKFDMLFFAAFGIISVIRIVFCILKVKRVPALVAVLAASFVLPLMFTVFSSVIPYAVVFEHIVIIAELCLVFFIALKDGK